VNRLTEQLTLPGGRRRLGAEFRPHRRHGAVPNPPHGHQHQANDNEQLHHGPHRRRRSAGMPRQRMAGPPAARPTTGERPSGRLGGMPRWLTAGESHGPALVGILEGLPAGVQITTDDVAAALARRRLGYGRGARMSFERDELEFVGGVRHGSTLGGPVALRIANSEWPKWEQ